LLRLGTDFQIEPFNNIIVENKLAQITTEFRHQGSYCAHVKAQEL